jgi:hypothetical protein
LKCDKISQHILAAQNFNFLIGQNVTENNKCHQTVCWQKNDMKNEMLSPKKGKLKYQISDTIYGQVKLYLPFSI